jgi:hypothetical protein
MTMVANWFLIAYVVYSVRGLAVGCWYSVNDIVYDSEDNDQASIADDYWFALQ